MEILSGVNNSYYMYGKLKNFTVARTKTGKMILRKRSKHKISDNISSKKELSNHNFSLAVNSFNYNVRNKKDRIQKWKKLAKKFNYANYYFCYISCYLNRIKEKGTFQTIIEANLNILNLKEKTVNKSKNDNKNILLNNKITNYLNKNETQHRKHISKKFIEDNGYENIWGIIPAIPDQFINYLNLMKIKNNILQENQNEEI